MVSSWRHVYKKTACLGKISEIIVISGSNIESDMHLINRTVLLSDYSEDDVGVIGITG
ncbi:hypothetical protein [Vibrio methylphosphonaticus]|uniref:hypothetical protein n=1 Tax=Vibrio methylphosphonaticus TaxID=2946866 RepID=UPI002029E6A4|nr:hypothetical protein [Vibrio methylphosphonaticus]MCL9777417.1 hypothetical protein [Vibrio methylphosphonaticus]